MDAFEPEDEESMTMASKAKSFHAAWVIQAT
jgi:hypothetical protein